MKDIRCNALTPRDEYALFMRAGRRDNSREHRALRRTVARVVEEELTIRQRQIVQLFFYDGMSAAEIAQELGLARSTVYRTMQRGMRRIERSMRYALPRSEED